jgi:ion channel
MSQRWFQLQTHFRRASALTGRKFFLLFLFLLGSLILYPFAQNSAFGYYAFRVLGSVVIVLSVYAVSFRRSLVIIALLLAIPTVLQRVLPTRADASFLSILNIVLSFVFDAFIVVVIFRRVFARDQPNSETIFGALCIYLLVGFSFASIYGMLATVQPNAFYLDPRINLHAVPDRFDFIYYSFGTITALGAAGITAVSGEARSVTVIEAIIGILYLAVLIARLMGAYRPAPPD